MGFSGFGETLVEVYKGRVMVEGRGQCCGVQASPEPCTAACDMPQTIVIA